MQPFRWMLVTCLACMLVAETEAARSAKATYAAAVAREEALGKRGPTRPPVAELRRVSVAYENVARAHPASGYADNALLKAANLAAEVFGRTGAEPDRGRAAKLYQWLASEYPHSPLAAQARASAKDLEPSQNAARTPAAAATSNAAPRSAVRGAAGAPDVAVPPVVGTGATPSRSDPSLAALREIRRTVLPDLVRVSIELDGEVAYRHERIDGPSRLFFDLKGTVTTPSLQDAVLSWPDDVVRQVRLGRQPQNTTRVVLDAEGVSRYSVFTLYNPFRVVIDLERGPEARAARPAAPATARAVGPSRGAAPVAAARPAPAVPVPLDTPVLAAEPRKPGSADTGPLSRQLPLAPEALITSRDIDLAAASEAPSRSAGKETTRTKGSSGDRPSTDTPAASRLPVPASPPGPTADVKAEASPSEEALAAAATPAPVAPSTNANGSFSIARQLGLGVSRIVIDPGHGGRDPGATGKGVGEAELVLDVALRLEKLLSKQAGFEVVLTRRTDEFVPLEERTAIANRQKADLFLSIHANASRNVNARGVETYFLNFASTPDAEAVAARENSASGRTMHNLPDIVRAIALNNKLDESRDLANMVQEALVRRLGAQNKQLRNLGVKQAPFVVLIGAAMPSVLAEISFVTNAQEAQLLRSPAYRQRVAEALLDAVVKYQRALKSVSTVALQ
jgi:N-acetylmuramoyl-L-alanine amidase